MQEQHIASAFDRDLEAIQAQIMKMGGLVENAIMEAAVSLETRDEERAEAVRRADKVIQVLWMTNCEGLALSGYRSPQAVGALTPFLRDAPSRRAHRMEPHEVRHSW